MNKTYFFFITCLEAGGAQRAMLQLIEHIKKVESDSSIYIFNLSHEGEELEYDLLKLSNELINLNLRKFSITKIFQLIKLIRNNSNNSIIIGWMYHAALFSWLLSFFCRPSSLLFSIHHSGVDSKNLSIRTLLIAYFVGLISYTRKVKKIIFCAKSSLRAHQKVGYPKKKSLVIFNGVNPLTTTPDLNPRSRDIFEVVMAARFDLIKNHENLFKAINSIKDDIPIALSLYGENITADNQDLVDLIHKYELNNHIFLKGVDPYLRNNFLNYDLLVLSSNSEAFPLVIPEAMICGVPCIASSVGDIPDIIGTLGWLVPPKDSNKLSEALLESYNAWLNKERWGELQLDCINRIEQNFSANNFCEGYYDSMSSL